MDAVDVEGLLLRNSEARRAYFRATEEGRKANGFLVAMLLLAVYGSAFVVSMLCACNDLTERGCRRRSHCCGASRPSSSKHVVVEAKGLDSDKRHQIKAR
jgi:hypothetical protein